MANTIKIGGSDIDAIYVGTNVVDKIYVGADQVWPLESFQFLLDRMPPSKYASNPVITHDVTYKNICPGGIIADPLDASKYLLYVGEFTGNTSVNARIALYTGNNSDPYTLTRVGVVISKGIAGDGDSTGARFGHPIYNGGTVYYYYSGRNDSAIQSVLLATSVDGGRTFTNGGNCAPEAIWTQHSA